MLHNINEALLKMLSYNNIILAIVCQFIHVFVKAHQEFYICVMGYPQLATLQPLTHSPLPTSRWDCEEDQEKCKHSWLEIRTM